IDPGRNQRPDYADNAVSSMRVWPAAFYPRHGSVDETLTTQAYSNADTAIYHISQIVAHADDSLQLAFNGAERFGLDNVSVIVANSGTNILLDNASFTLAAWSKATNNDAAVSYLIAQGPGVQNEGLRFGFRGSDTAACSFWGNDLRVPIALDTDWHHWVCTYDAGTKTRTLYRDGVQIGQDTATSNYIGQGPTQLGSLFAGIIDEVGIWTVPLTAAEVQDLYQKVKIEDESVLVCQMPLPQSDAKVTFGVLTLRETTTRLGDVNQTLNRTITVDADSPSAAMSSGFFSSQAPGPYVSSPGRLVLTGSADDPTSFIRTVTVKPAGADWQPATGTEAWSYVWDTTSTNDGPQTLELQATDAVGNAGAPAAWHTILDTTPPTTAFTPAATTIRPTRNSAGRWLVPLNGTVDDPAAGGLAGSGVAKVEVLLQGRDGLGGLGWQPATVGSAGTWQLDYVMPVFGADGQSVPDPSGVYTATLRATDNVSNTTPPTGYATVVVQVDGDAPAVTASAALSNTTVLSRAVQIGGQVTSADTVQAVELSLVAGAQMGALNGAILHLPMDENLATEYFDDQSGTNHDATCDGSACPTVGQPGQHDLAFRFDGVDDVLTVDDINLAGTSFTVAVWAKRDASGVNVDFLSQGSQGQQSELEFGFRATNDVTCGFGGDNLNTTEVYPETGWHHWACTYDSATGQRAIYRDGVAVAVSAAAGAYTGSGTFFIGSQLGQTNYFAGLLDQVTVHARALAAYEVANLYGYGRTDWLPASLSGDTWSYAIPGGDDGIEGLYQINVRGVDALGNITPQGGQRVWRGLIDTKPPSVTAPVTVTTAGSATSTTFVCQAADFSLDDDTSCTADWVPPQWRESDRAFTMVGDVNPWYGATFTETQRLYAIDATRVYTTETPVPDVNVTACDSYGHCTTVATDVHNKTPATVATDVHNETLATLGTLLQSPLPGDVVTSLDPIQLSGHLVAAEGAALLVVKLDGSTRFQETRLDGTPVDEEWAFTWTPPGSGRYALQAVVYDWSDYHAAQATAETAPPAPVAGPHAGLAHSLYFPLMVGAGSRLGAGADGRTRQFLPLVTTGSGAFIAGRAATIYVDLESPVITIDPVVLTADRARGRNGLLLSGLWHDDAALASLYISVNGAAWQRVHPGADGRWRYIHFFAHRPEGHEIQVSVRATDVAGHVTMTTDNVFVDADAPRPGDLALFYIDRAGVRHPVAPNTIRVDAAAIGVAWGAATDATDVAYRVGFSHDFDIAAGDLTTYAAPGEEVRPVAAGERWYARVDYVDAVGNTAGAVLGPLFVGPERRAAQ
ncbi:MAG: LamG domain-containing protein, partial [Caldilineaceae bacterium]|nr:LamG domain-containing protein [Caldilineaceae bacterium]